MPGKHPIFVAILFLYGLLTTSNGQTFSVLHTFKGPDGAESVAPLVLDNAGNIYGTTGIGGIGKNCPTFSTFGCGSAFMLNKSGKEVALFSFNGANGAGPDGGLLRDARGNLYGTTQNGGATGSLCPDTDGCGVAYRLDRTGKEIEYKFQGGQDGFNPTGSLAEDLAGNFYGTTRFGGMNGLGTIFKIDVSGRKTVLYSFTGFADGCDPTTGVILDSGGNLYGIANNGGEGFCNSGYGTVFKLSSSEQFSVIHTFNFGDGAYPDSILLFDAQGNLYGTTGGGGSGAECASNGGCGTVFELYPQSDGSWSEKLLHSFCSLPSCTDGDEPSGGLARDQTGNLYGTAYFGGISTSQCGGTCGVAFELNTVGEEFTLHSFTGGVDGAFPAGGLTLDTSGNLYGTTQGGGASGDGCANAGGCGVVFKITP